MTYPTPGHREPGDAPTDTEQTPAAVLAAAKGSAAWADAARLQRWAPKADHHDFYVLAGEAVSTVEQLGELVAILRAQVADYAGTPGLFDDVLWISPTRRIAEALGALGAVARALSMAGDELGEFWSAIGHIGVEES